MIFHPEKKDKILAKRARRKNLKGMPQTDTTDSPDDVTNNEVTDSPFIRRLRLLAQIAKEERSSSPYNPMENRVGRNG